MRTHIKWNGSGLIQGANSRFEVIGRNEGLWFPAEGTNPNLLPKILFAINDIERSRIGNNGFTRIGLNSNNVDAVRRLEVFDGLNAPQFRITQTHNSIFTDFQTTSFGDLFINPRNNGILRAVGIGVSNPSQILDVSGNARLRLVPTHVSPQYLMTGVIQQDPNDIIFSKLAFSNLPNTVLFGDGTWGPVPTSTANTSSCTTAQIDFMARWKMVDPINNTYELCKSDIYETPTGRIIGIGTANPVRKVEIFDERWAQLRLTHDNAFITAAYTDFRTIQPGNLLINPDGVNGPGKIGIGLTPSDPPTQTLDVNGEARIREVNQNDDLDQVLVIDNDGIVHWRDASTIGGGSGNMTASNGATVNPSGNVQWGQNLAGGSGGALLHNTEIPMNNKNILFTGSGNGVNRIGIGTTSPAAKVSVLTTTDDEAGRFFNNRVSSSFNTGIFIQATGSTSSNIALYAQALGSNDYSAWLQGKVFVNGDVDVNGNVYANNISDGFFKNNIDTIIDPLTIINTLQPKTFYFDTLNNYNLKLSNKRQYGFIAQDVEPVLADLVKYKHKTAVYDSSNFMVTDSITYRYLNYEGFIAI
ncbi:MAG: tail fiber domain-containing protein [Bacteroidetes bacterium]|nr:tail fiber domain-containing protein [Bacteroidota bacterium]